MSNKSIEYYEIATIQIDRAIQLYFEKDYICAITLAGAGEEILGKLLSAEGKEDSLSDVLKELKIKNPTLEIKQMRDMINLPRNALKHLKIEAFESELPIKTSAEIFIRRAILNYVRLRNFKTKYMNDFINNEK